MTENNTPLEMRATLQDISLNTMQPQEMVEPQDIISITNLTKKEARGGYICVGLGKETEIFNPNKRTAEEEAIISQNGTVTRYAKAESDSDKRDIEANIVISENYSEFAELEEAGYGDIVKKLSRFDERVYQVLDSFYMEGYRIVPISAIYTRLGGHGNPSAEDKAKIVASIRKMKTLIISYSNKEEREKLGYNYPPLEITDEHLITCRLVKITDFYGQETQAVQFAGFELPLMKISRSRRQLTTIASDVFALPFNESDMNTAIYSYIIKRQAQIKNSIESYKRSGKKGRKRKPTTRILYNTVFEEAGITERWQKSRAKQIIHKSLDNLVVKKEIASYTKQNDGVTLKF